MLGIALIIGATLALAAWAASWRFIAAQKDKTIAEQDKLTTEQARYITDLEEELFKEQIKGQFHFDSREREAALSRE